MYYVMMALIVRLVGLRWWFELLASLTQTRCSQYGHDAEVASIKNVFTLLDCGFRRCVWKPVACIPSQLVSLWGVLADCQRANCEAPLC